MSVSHLPQANSLSLKFTVINITSKMNFHNWTINKTESRRQIPVVNIIFQRYRALVLEMKVPFMFSAENGAALRAQVV